MYIHLIYKYLLQQVLPKQVQRMLYRHSCSINHSAKETLANAFPAPWFCFTEQCVIKKIKCLHLLYNKQGC